jgi:hypothetical protein
MGEQPTFDGITRRSALGHIVLGAAGWVILGSQRPGLAAAPVSAPPPVPAAGSKAKAVIQIWMWGGPCHIDTFDPKPDAGHDYCGPLDKPIETNVKGTRIGQLLPLLAQQADKYSIIRSMTHGNNGHETASYLVQTGRPPGERVVYPCAGAVVSLFKGYDHGYQGLIPPYIVLTRPQGRFSEAGFLGSKYKPFATGSDPNAQVFAVEGIVAEGITTQQQKNRRQFLHRLDTLGGAMPKDPNFEQLDASETKAYDLILGDAGKLFDLSGEKQELREAYGRNTFGQSCLMARRLVEHGVPYVTINYNGWDTHKQHFEIMNRKLPELDKGMSTLLTDLQNKGLLDSTVVWWSGEFGRTPKVMWDAPWNGGRGHHGECFCAVVAGGGYKGGQVLGASDPKGHTVADHGVHPQDLIGSMYQLLGIDPDSKLPNPRGEDLRVTTPDRLKLGEIMSV